MAIRDGVVWLSELNESPDPVSDATALVTVTKVSGIYSVVTKARYLSEKSVRVLRLIADGHSYSQIVDGNPDIKYRDIFDAAERLCV